MNILLCGQKRFGRDTLQLLLDGGHTLTAVACPADTGDRLWIACQNEGLPVIPAGTLSAATMPGGVDLIVAAHSHDFIGRKTRLRARLGAIGFHPSLLPLHRGRDAIRWAIRLRERVTGGSVYWLDDTVDGGPLAAQELCFIRPEDDALTLWSRDLAPMGLRLFARALADISAGRLVKVPQDAALVTWEPSLDGAPRLHRPDLEQLGDGTAAEFEIVRDYLLFNPARA